MEKSVRKNEKSPINRGFCVVDRELQILYSVILKIIYKSFVFNTLQLFEIIAKVIKSIKITKLLHHCCTKMLHQTIFFVTLHLDI